MIDLLHAQHSAILLVEGIKRRGESQFITPHVVYELYRGARQSAVGGAENRLMGRLIENFRVLPFDRESALLAARMASYLEERGVQIPELDVFIAASVIVWGDGVIATRDAKHFRRLARFGLVVRQG